MTKRNVGSWHKADIEFLARNARYWGISGSKQSRRELSFTAHRLCRSCDAAFKLAGWSQADRLGLASSWRMIRAFVFNSPYPTAPFSTLYLFGRGQDVGFQKAIDNSPRKRHHIRFWALSLAYSEANLGKASFWLNRDRPPDAESV